MKQNRFFSFVSALSTALTIAFVMVAYMVFYLGSSNLKPEINRTRSLYSDQEYAFRTSNNSNRNRGMSLRTAKAITQTLPSAQLVSYHTVLTSYTSKVVGGEGSRAKREGRFVDLEWWKLMEYEFIDGTPFTESDYAAKRNVIVVTERMAQEMFNTTEVLGREVLIDYTPYLIRGVVKNVSSQFTLAYSDFWANLLSIPGVEENGAGSENVNGQIRFIVVAQNGKKEALKQEIEKGIVNFNSTLADTTFKMEIASHTDFTFSKFLGLNPVILYILLGCIFLVVPAVNISGLIYSMLNKRYEEIGVRKVYGASNSSIVGLFLTENMAVTLIGGVTGLLFSFITLYFFRGWLLGVSVVHSSSLELSLGMLFKPSVFGIALVFCLLFNLLSTFIPVWYVSKKNIAETLRED